MRPSARATRPHELGLRTHREIGWVALAAAVDGEEAG